LPVSFPVQIIYRIVSYRIVIGVRHSGTLPAQPIDCPAMSTLPTRSVRQYPVLRFQCPRMY